MSFGLCPYTNKTFAEKFPASSFHSLPSPSSVTAEVQFQRAQEIEAEYGRHACTSFNNCTNNHKYLFVMLNEYNEFGAIGCTEVCPGAVKELIFRCQQYPGDFVWLVIDPKNKEEVAFLVKYNNRCDELIKEKYEDRWWYEALARNVKEITDEIAEEESD